MCVSVMAFCAVAGGRWQVAGGRRAQRERMAVSIFTYMVSIFLRLWRVSSPRMFGTL